MTGMLKAISAGLIGFGGALLTAVQSGDTITNNEWWFVIGTTLVALGGVWAVPNMSSSRENV